MSFVRNLYTDPPLFFSRFAGKGEELQRPLRHDGVEGLHLVAEFAAQNAMKLDRHGGDAPPRQWPARSRR